MISKERGGAVGRKLLAVSSKPLAVGRKLLAGRLAV